MGNRASSFFVRKDPDGSKSKAIDKVLKQEEKRMKTEAKILLLGKYNSHPMQHLQKSSRENQESQLHSDY